VVVADGKMWGGGASRDQGGGRVLGYNSLSGGDQGEGRGLKRKRGGSGLKHWGICKKNFPFV